MILNVNIIILSLITNVLTVASAIPSKTEDDILKESQFPGQAFIFDKSIREEPFICGGVVIDKWWIISNAHCFITSLPGRSKRKRPAPKYYAVTGVNNLRDFRYRIIENAFISEVDTVFPHPMYDYQGKTMDVALLKMKRSFPNENVSNISKDPFPSKERTCILIGWREQGMFGGSLFCDGLLTGVLHEDTQCDADSRREYVDIAAIYNWIAPRMPNLRAHSLNNLSIRTAIGGQRRTLLALCWIVYLLCNNTA